MKPHYVYRWVNNHGLIRLFNTILLRRGDLFARLIGSAEGIDNPYGLIEEMRGEGGLHRALPVWITFDHDMVREILRDNRFGVGIPTVFGIPRPVLRALEHRPLPPNPVDPPSMLVIDQSEHTRMRKPVTAAFTPRAVARLRDRIETVTEELLDALPDDGPADLVARYAAQVPIAIISEMLGFPDSDREMFLRWGDDISPLLDLGISWQTHQRAMESSERVHRYLIEHVERLRAEPGDDILSSLVTAGDLSTYELCASATLLMAAGFETTVNLIGKGIIWLLRHPEQVDRLRAEPELWPNAVEEILRIDPPVQTTARRCPVAREVDGGAVAGRREPRPRRVHRPGPFRHHPGQRQESSVLRQRYPCVPGRRSGPYGSDACPARAVRGVSEPAIDRSAHPEVAVHPARLRTPSRPHRSTRP
jgi:cytochrome P450